MPTFAPSFAPVTNPSDAPSTTPSTAPSIAPSIAPSTSPTLAPTLAPTFPPTIPPTISPSIAPSSSPSTTPSRVPSISSEHQTEIDLDIKAHFTRDFSKIIIYATSLIIDTNIIDLRAHSVQPWNCSDIFFNNTYNMLSSQALCHLQLELKFGHNNETHFDMFVITLSEHSKVMTYDLLLVNTDVIMSVFESIFQNSNNNNNSVEITIANDLDYSFQNSNYVIIPNITWLNNSIYPNIIISNFVDTIGICDDLILDARNSYNLGGRAAVFIWEVDTYWSNRSNTNQPDDSLTGHFVYFGSFATVSMTDRAMVATNSNYKLLRYCVTLTVSVWYAGNITKMFNVSVVSDEIIANQTQILPIVSISGPSIVDIGDNSYFLSLYSRFELLSNLTCLQSIHSNNYSHDRGMDSNSVFEYQINWSVSETSGQVDTIWMNEYLINNSKVNTDDLIIPFTEIQSMLIGGYYYTFNLDFNCQYYISSFNFNCRSVRTTHVVYYQQPDLICQITGGSLKTITNVSTNVDSVSSRIYLDGNTFTHDPSMADIKNKSHLIFEWDCLLNRFLDCNDIIYGIPDVIDNEHPPNSLANVNISALMEIVNTSNSNFDLPHEIILDLVLTVTDSRQNIVNNVNMTRQCQAYQTITFFIVDDSQADVFLDLSLTAVKSEIKRNERVRLMANINNLNAAYQNEIFDSYTFEYSEMNGYLSNDDIANFRIKTVNSINGYGQANLILSENVLEQGLAYNFNLDVKNVESKSIAKANAIVTVVSPESSIIDGSFDIKPNCENVSFSSLRDLVDLTFDLSVNAYSSDESDYESVKYQFSLQWYDELELEQEADDNDFDMEVLLHSELLSQPYLDNVVLPIGSYWIKVTVFDKNNAYTSSIVQKCNIDIATSNYSTNLDNNIDEAINYFSSQISLTVFTTQYGSINKRYTFYLQFMQALMLYFDRNAEIGNSDNILISNNILDLIVSHFGPENANLCHTTYVIQLSQIFRMWMDVTIKYYSYNYNDNDNDNYFLVYEKKAVAFDILQQILDPCGMNYIAPNFEKQLNLGVGSIVSQNEKIYWNSDSQTETDATANVSYLLQSGYFDSYFHAMVESSIELLDQFTQLDYARQNDEYFLLLKNSLYVWNLLRLSTAIQSESLETHKYYNFDIFSTRILNQTVETTLSYDRTRPTILSTDSTVTINNQDTAQGRSEFSSYYEPFDSVDIIVISLDTSIKYLNDINYNYSNTSTSVFNISNAIVIDILGSERNNTPTNSHKMHMLEKNMTIVHVFNESVCNDNWSTKNDLVCVWYNESTVTWHTDGCVTSLMSNELNCTVITCSCNHLTSFAILWHVQQSEYETQDAVEGDDDQDGLFDAYRNNVYFGLVLGLLMIGFTSVACYVLKLFYTLKCKYEIGLRWKNEKGKCEIAFGIIVLVLLQSLAQFVSCLLYFLFIIWLPFTESGEYKDSKLIFDIFGEFLTSGLFVPLIVSFYIYSCIIYGLSLVAFSVAAHIETLRRKIFKLIIISNIFITLVLTSMGICFIFDIAKYNEMKIVLVISASIYLLLLFIVLSLVLYLTHAAYKTINATMSMLKTNVDTGDLSKNNQENQSDQMKTKMAIRRIFLSTFALSMFLMLQMISLIVFIINPSMFNPIVQMVELIGHFVYLAFVIWFYKQYFKVKIEMASEIRKC